MTVYKLDRFSRDKYESTIHKHTLKENGVKLVSAMENIPDSPEGIILESLLEGMNQYYSAELSQKVLRGMRESYLKGNYTGGILLYGFNVIDKKVVEAISSFAYFVKTDMLVLIEGSKLSIYLSGFELKLTKPLKAKLDERVLETQAEALVALHQCLLKTAVSLQKEVAFAPEEKGNGSELRKGGFRGNRRKNTQ